MYNFLKLKIVKHVIAAAFLLPLDSFLLGIVIHFEESELYITGFPVALTVKNLSANAGDARGAVPVCRQWHSTPVFLPGKFHRQRSLVGYSPWRCKELDSAEQRNNSVVSQDMSGS